jgi:hypothetical protein
LLPSSILPFAFYPGQQTWEKKPKLIPQLKYGFTPFLSSPSGCHPPLSTKKTFRNPFARYHGYHTSTPELVGLFEWCPLPKEREDVGDDGEGMDVYPGILPWREGGGGEKGLRGEREWWGRERD